jgi:lysophospholipase L1-like esterase
MPSRCRLRLAGLSTLQTNQRKLGMRIGALFALACLCLLGVLAGVYSGAFRPIIRALARSQSWEPTIRQFEQQDKANPPKAGSIVFTGSSSIARWESLGNDMKPLEVINRGFGGSEFSDLDEYARRIVVAYQPKAVVVYEGDNDLSRGSSKTPESVANDFRKFVQIVHADLPETWIYIISIKPSRARWNEWPRMKAADKLMLDFSETQQRVQYIDVASAMFDANGVLPTDLFVSDGLHPSAKCYALWTSIIKPVLLQRFGPNGGTE